ncbi:NAD-dependent epimerase/dehydratase family protein [bacterium]|nr:NAD-dependent epimerase/dehydratase family protein [bacterium]
MKQAGDEVSQQEKIIAVTGAAGFVGSAVVKELLEHGYSVRALVRPTSKLDQLAERLCCVPNQLAEQPRLTLYQGDITDPTSLATCFSSADTIIHIAALFRQAKHPPEVYRAVNITGTENVLQIAKKSGAKRVVHCSTVGVHSHIPRPPADEEEAYRPGDIYQETKCEGEKRALEWFRQGKIPGIVIRPAMIWGPGDERTRKLFRGVAKGTFPFIGWRETKLHWVSVLDLARAFRLAAEVEMGEGKEVKSGEIFIIGGKSDITLKELLQKIAHAVGVNPPKLRIPALPVQLAGSLCEAICIPLGIEPPLHRRRVDFFTKDRSFSIQKARNLLNYEPRGTIDQEIEEIVTWYQNHHQLT